MNEDLEALADELIAVSHSVTKQTSTMDEWEREFKKQLVHRIGEFIEDATGYSS